MKPLQPIDVLPQAERLRPPWITADRRLHLAHPLVKEGQVALALWQLLHGEDLLLLRDLQKFLLHTGVDGLQLRRKLIVLLHQLPLDIPTLALQGRSVLEELIHTAAIAVVLLRQVVDLLEHLVHLAVRARAV